jgi:hypothetical protein
MNEDSFNISIRKFLKMVGVKSQHEIEQAVQRACSEGRLQGAETLPANMVLRIPQLGLEVTFDGRIELE